ncbi:MAG: TRAP transporter substrate-binding protein DctP, partial [Sphaerochaetaceae bacterium]|nr:TRAP transporter substrate-binding protein DctP [Sphaerochaetaceae bacterium]
TIQIPYGSVYSALQVGKVDGAENNMPSYLYTGHYESAPYVFMDEHFRLPEMVVMSGKAKEEIAALGPEFLEIVKSCARESGTYERSLWKKEEYSALNDLKKKGVAITVPDKVEKERFKEAMSVIYNDLSEENASIVDKIKNE